MSNRGRELLNKLTHGKLRGREWLELEKKILAYMHNEATEEELLEFKKYTEMLYMTCRAVERTEMHKN